eukprot:115878_1
MLSENEFMSKKLELEKLNSGSFGGSDSSSWLISLATSLFQSLILWQPLTVYVMTLIKIWMFSWHLKMAVGPGNCISLSKRCCHCCGKYNPNDDENNCDKNHFNSVKLLKMLSKRNDNNNAGANDENTAGDIFTDNNRPLDIISFLASDEFVIDDINSTHINTIDERMELEIASDDKMNTKDLVNENVEIKQSFMDKLKKKSSENKYKYVSNETSKTEDLTGRVDDIGCGETELVPIVDDEDSNEQILNDQSD